MVEFRETAPGEYLSLIPIGAFLSGDLNIRGTGTDGDIVETTFTLPGLKRTPSSPSYTDITIEKRTPEPDTIGKFREPAILRLLLIAAVLLIIMDELFRPPGVEEGKTD